MNYAAANVEHACCAAVAADVVDTRDEELVDDRDAIPVSGEDPDTEIGKQSEDLPEVLADGRLADDVPFLGAHLDDSVDTEGGRCHLDIAGPERGL